MTADGVAERSTSHAAGDFESELLLHDNSIPISEFVGDGNSEGNEPTATETSRTALRPDPLYEGEDFIGDSPQKNGTLSDSRTSISLFPKRTFDSEIVPPDDDRKPVTLPQRWVPFRWICSLECQLTKPKQLRMATGFLIGPSTVLTAAHNLLTKTHPWTQFDRIRVVPARTERNAPFGHAEAQRSDWLWPTQWDSRNPNKLSEWDFAVIRLRRAIGSERFKSLKGQSLGWWGGANTEMRPATMRKFGNKTPHIRTTGYPLDKCGWRQLRNEKEIKKCAHFSTNIWASTQWWSVGDVVGIDRGFLLHTADTFEGQSGSPIWRYWKNNKTGKLLKSLVGIQLRGGKNIQLDGGKPRTLNFAILMNKRVIDAIADLQRRLGILGP
jgi:V8-like Glu-specific endopeptidase